MAIMISYEIDEIKKTCFRTHSGEMKWSINIYNESRDKLLFQFVVILWSYDPFYLVFRTERSMSLWEYFNYLCQCDLVDM